jgi:filamentous hemagglutinin family protein
MDTRAPRRWPEIAALIVALAAASEALAGALTDGSAGPRVELSGDFEIGDALGTRRGDNLFHSFERFSLDAGERATFSGPEEIRNVISRVTGGERSDIDGTIKSTIAGADFYFLNPAGVMFGPNASLDLQGSFHVSTADELRFADGAKFSASNPTASSLTVAAPEAFGFLRAKPSAIAVDGGTLEVPAGGETLSIVGGNLSLRDGVMAAPAGTVNLISAASPIEVRAADGATASVSGGNIEIARSTVFTGGDGGGTVRIRGGNLVIEDRSRIDASNLGDRAGRASVGVQVGGDLTLRHSLMGAGGFGSGSGGTVNISAAKLMMDGGQIDAGAFGSGGAGSVALDVMGEISIAGTPLSDQPGVAQLGVRSGVYNNTQTAHPAGTISIDAAELSIADHGNVTASTFGEGSGGHIVVDAGEVRLRDGAQIFSSTFDKGAAGTVMIESHEIEIIGDRSGLVTGILSSAEVGSGGPGGQIEIVTDKLTIARGLGAIQSAAFGEGNAGLIKIEADDLRISGDSSDFEPRVSSPTTGPGKGGIIEITGGDIFVDFGFIGANTFGTNDEADAGSVIINAHSLHFVNDGRVFNGTNGPGDGGDIDITAGTITADVGSNPTIFHTGIASTAEAGSTGSSGNVTVRADEIRLINGGQITTSTQGDGKAGVVNIEGGDIFVDFGLIGANTFGTNEDADAGAVIVNADLLHFVNEGRIFNGTNGAGDGGDVHVTADTIIADATVDHVSEFHTGIASTAEADSAGASGSVKVRAGQIRLVNGGLIATSSHGVGNAGNVIVVARESLAIRGRSADRPSSISVSSQNPLAPADVGNLEIEAPVVEVSDGSRIEATNAGLGRSGGVTVEAQTLRLANGAAITAGSDQVDAGDIEIMVEELVDLRRSSITTSAADGDGGGGNILIHPRFVVLDRSEIVATARRGAGGSIVVVADNFIQSPDSVLDASSDLGLPGTVLISSPEVDLSGGLVVLEGALLDAASQLRERCGVRRDIGASSFTGVGRGGLPPSPDGPLASAYLVAPRSRGGSLEERATMAASSDRPVLVAALCFSAP